MTALMAGTTLRGMFEERVKGILDEIKADPSFILFMDNIGAILADKGKNDYEISAMLARALENGDIQVIGTSDLTSYRKTFDKDPSLARRFQKIIVEAPNAEESIEILNGLKPFYEDFHKVSYETDAIEACVTLAERYISERNLPDSAIDILDEIGALKGTIQDSDKVKELRQNIKMSEAIKADKQKDKDYEAVDAIEAELKKLKKQCKTEKEKFAALLYIKTVNGYSLEDTMKRKNFEDLTPIFPDERIKLDQPGAPVSIRIVDLLSPIGKGQRGMIVSPPKAGKTTLLKEVAKSVKKSNPDVHLIILLIDERPEEVTDIREAIEGPNVEVIYSTFDELPEHHKRVSEMVIERAKRLVEHKKDVMILLDSITRLTRAYNLTVPPSGRTLSGGLDPAALHMPKRFFGAARNMREGGSLTILATALVDTGSKMDDVVYEEFKGTGNMEMVLDRKLSEKRVFPAIDIPKSGTRREDLLLSQEEMEAINIIRKAFNGMKADEAVDKVIDMFSRTKNNDEFVAMTKKMRFF